MFVMKKEYPQSKTVHQSKMLGYVVQINNDLPKWLTVIMEFSDKILVTRRFYYTRERTLLKVITELPPFIINKPKKSNCFVSKMKQLTLLNDKNKNK